MNKPSACFSVLGVACVVVSICVVSSTAPSLANSSAGSSFPPISVPVAENRL